MHRLHTLCDQQRIDFQLTSFVNFLRADLETGLIFWLTFQIRTQKIHERSQ